MHEQQYGRVSPGATRAHLLSCQKWRWANSRPAIPTSLAPRRSFCACRGLFFRSLGGARVPGLYGGHRTIRWPGHIPPIRTCLPIALGEDMAGHPGSAMKAFALYALPESLVPVMVILETLVDAIRESPDEHEQVHQDFDDVLSEAGRLVRGGMMRALDLDRHGLLALVQMVRGKVSSVHDTGLVDVEIPGTGLVACEVLQTDEFAPLVLRVGDRVLIASPEKTGEAGCVLGKLGAAMQRPSDRSGLSNRGLVLRCGKASISLREDGKVVIRGTEIVTIASRSNRVKGGSVEIN